MDIKKSIPNFITLLNLLSGCFAITFIFADNLLVAAFLIFLSAFFDFFDGFVARALHVKSELGKELDSLADIISFGVVPGFIMMKLLQNSFENTREVSGLSNLVPYLALLIPVFSALRLAKFNTDIRQTEIFIGLPTPANAMLIASFPLILSQQTTLPGIEIIQIKILFENHWILLFLTFLLSYLLVAEIPLMSLKLSNTDQHKNNLKYIFIGISVVLLILFYYAAIPLILALYLLISVFMKSKI